MAIHGPTACQVCGAPIQQTGGSGPTRRFCSQRCCHAACAARFATQPITETTRTCTSCGNELPLEAFPRSATSRAGRRHWCSPCGAQRCREWREARRDQLRAQWRLRDRRQNPPSIPEPSPTA